MDIFCTYCSDKLFRPDITAMVDWVLKIIIISGHCYFYCHYVVVMVMIV